MRLYHHPLSSNARRAVMTAHELGLLREAEQGNGPRVSLSLVDLAKGEQRAPTYLAMNPNGRVPTLDDDGFYLTESHAIMQYLAELTPGQTLYPTELRARANVNRWLFWNAHHFAPAVGVLSFERVVKKLIGKGEADPAETARGDALVALFAGILDSHLASREWIAGDEMTLADLAISTPLQITIPAKLPIGDLANIASWMRRVTARESWKHTMG